MTFFTRLPLRLGLLLCLSYTANSMDLKEFAETYGDSTGTVSTLSIQIYAHPNEQTIGRALAIAPSYEGDMLSPADREGLLQQFDTLAQNNKAFLEVYKAMLPFYGSHTDDDDQLNILRFLLGAYFESERLAPLYGETENNAPILCQPNKKDDMKNGSGQEKSPTNSTSPSDKNQHVQESN